MATLINPNSYSRVTMGKKLGLVKLGIPQHPNDVALYVIWVRSSLIKLIGFSYIKNLYEDDLGIFNIYASNDKGERYSL